MLLSLAGFGLVIAAMSIAPKEVDIPTYVELLVISLIVYLFSFMFYIFGRRY